MDLSTTPDHPPFIRTVDPTGRRRFIRRAGAAAIGGLVAPAVLDPLRGLAGASGRLEGGSDLNRWQTVVGDGVWAGAGQSGVSGIDVATDHHGDRSTLRANVERRGVMAHNITFLRREGLDDLKRSQKVTTHIRLPKIPSTGDWDWSIQTVEVGLFIWDGAVSRLDHGVAVQWVLNPWDPDSGILRVWDQTEDGPRWVPVSWLSPDTEWHEFGLQHRANKGSAILRVDGSTIPIDKTFTVKHPTWSNTIDARFQIELISVWPGDHTSVPPASVEVQDWTWTEVG